MTREIVTFVVDYPDGIDFDSIDWSLVARPLAITLQPIGHVPAGNGSAAETDGGHRNEQTVMADLKPGEWFLDFDGDLNYVRKTVGSPRSGDVIEVHTTWVTAEVPLDERGEYAPGSAIRGRAKGRGASELCWTLNDPTWTRPVWRIKNARP